MIAKEEYTLAQAIQSRLTLHEMRMYYRLSSDDIVRVFFLAHAGPPQRLQETATECPHDSGHSVALHLQRAQRHNPARRPRPNRPRRVAAEPVGQAGESGGP